MKSFAFCPLCATPLNESFIGGRDRMSCPRCGWVHYINPLPVAIALTVNRNNELLMIRRAHEPAFNEWALPGGFLEAGERPEEGCLRELFEETSLEGTIDKLIGVWHLESGLYGSLIAVAYRVIAAHERISINHEVFEAGFYRPDNMPPVRIPLHRQIIAESRWPERDLSLTL
ncbi:MAG TPA: NUDIX hydrolase [Chlorobaculum sp.]|jgi:ADP-ribose pyrophosphatase YjhB (NUDIX family)|nr:NUDIX hydrolase [Chlorobaculum tepidum]HBU22815.1 NUDIX hydrolase [Chlorobaculum sp.]